MASSNILDRLLTHVIEVEAEMITLSGESHRRISEWMNNSGISLNDEVIEAMQYQDILSQQLTATSEAMMSIREHLGEIFDTSNQDALTVIDAIDTRMVDVLDKAQFKRSAFGGKVHCGDEEGIEFF